MNDEQVTILKNSVAKGASDEELKYCLTVARRYRLDPFRQQIWFIKRWDSGADDGHGGTGAHKWVPQVGIYGMAHIAARDHKDFGSFSLPEYGPTITIDVEGKKITGPAWARVKAYKKGLAEPSYGEAWFEEYCPRRYSNTKFWREMGRRMIAKCAKAQAMREAYPDLGGLYIPEEMERMSEDYTASGRQITDANGFSPSGQPVTYEANRQLGKTRQQEVLDEKLGHGHEPGSDKARMAEAALKRVEDADRELKDKKSSGASRTPSPDTATVPSTEIRTDTGQRPQTHPASMPSDKPLGTIELDLTTPDDPIIRGDIGDLLDLIKKHCVAEWRADWWHIVPADVQTIHAMGKQLNYRVVEILPREFPSTPQGGKRVATSQEEKKGNGTPSDSSKSSNPPSSRKEQTKPTASAGKPQSPGAEPFIVTGTIERVFVTIKGNKSFAMVTIKTPEGAKREAGCWDKDVYGYLDKGKGKDAEVFFQTKGNYTNITGLKRIGRVEFEHNKVPILNRDREPGAAGNLFQP